jgi:hypothetical protein
MLNTGNAAKRGLLPVPDAVVPKRSVSRPRPTAGSGYPLVGDVH